MLAWWLAARPATLWAAVAPVLVGTACAALADGLRPLRATVALFGAVLLQIGTNLVNDLADFERGADNEERVGPARAVQSGWLSAGQVRAGAVLVFALAALAGAALVYWAGWWFAPVWVLAILAGIAYTAGPAPLGYLGLGDVTVFLFFGVVAVVGTCYVQTGEMTATSLWAAAPVGALATAILVVNNLRDRDTDRRAGKRTLAVRFGARATRWEYGLLLALAYATPAVLGWRLGSPWPLLSWLSLPVAAGVVRIVARTDGPALNAALGGTARLLLVFSVLLSAGLVLAHRGGW